MTIPDAPCVLMVASGCEQQLLAAADVAWRSSLLCCCVCCQIACPAAAAGTVWSYSGHMRVDAGARSGAAGLGAFLQCSDLRMGPQTVVQQEMGGSMLQTVCDDWRLELLLMGAANSLPADPQLE
jgi:hypothetical protein